MTYPEWTALVRRTRARAERLRTEILTCAAAAEQAGCVDQGATLRQIAERPAVVAARYISQMVDEVEEF